MKNTYLFTAILAVGLCQTTVRAQFFHPDSTFGTNGYVLPAYSGADQAHAVLVQPADQKIVVAGFHSTNCYVARFLPNGQPDMAFGTAGRTTFKFGNFSSYGYALALQSDGKILVAGDASLGSAGLARLTANGVLDPTFDTDGRLTVPTPNVPNFDSDARLGLAVQPADQRIVLGITTAPDSAKNKVATIHRFLPDGSADLSFSNDGKALVDFSPGKNEVVSAVAVQADGKIVVGVFASIEGGNYGNRFAVSRLLTDGSLDNTFGNAGITIAGKGVLLDMRIQPDGKITTAGYNRYFSFPEEEKDIALMRFLPSGALDPDFGTGGTVYTDYGWCHANGMTLQPDGRIVVAGFRHPNNPFDFLVGRYNSNGSLDLTFRTDGFWAARINGKDEELHKVAMQANGDIVAVGYYELGGQDESVMVRLTPQIQTVLPPVAQFTAAPTMGCGPLSVQFSDQSTGGAATSWLWNFSGGIPSTSSEQNPTVTYATAGTYSVTLTAMNAAGSNTATQSGFITVNPLPTAGFSTLQNGAIVTFSNISTNATSYSWSFGDTQTSTTASPEHTYATDGTYSVTLTATNGCGSTTSTQTVIIVTLPTANFTATPTTGCAPLEVKFTSTASTNTSGWLWNFSGGIPSTSSEQNPTVTYATAGTYSVTLTAMNAAGSNTATQSVFITVNPLPIADFSASLNGAIVTFSNTSMNTTSYIWSFGDSQTSTEVSPSHTYAVAGTYTVILTAIGLCGSATSTQEVLIGPGLVADFSASISVGCAPLTVEFTDQSQGATSWAWTFEGGSPPVSTDQNPTVTYSIPGKYDVKLEAGNPTFGTKVKTVDSLVVIHPLPNSAFSIEHLGGNTYQFHNTSIGANSYMWDFPGGLPATSTEESPTVIFATTDTFTVTLSALNNCGASILQKMLTTTSNTDDPAWAAGLRLFPNPTGGVLRVEILEIPSEEVEFSLFDPMGRLLRRESRAFWGGPIVQIFDLSSCSSGLFALRIRAGEQSTVRWVVVDR